MLFVNEFLSHLKSHLGAYHSNLVSLSVSIDHYPSEPSTRGEKGWRRRVVRKGSSDILSVSSHISRHGLGNESRMRPSVMSFSLFLSDPWVKNEWWKWSMSVRNEDSQGSRWAPSRKDFCNPRIFIIILASEPTYRHDSAFFLSFGCAYRIISWFTIFLFIWSLSTSTSKRYINYLFLQGMFILLQINSMSVPLPLWTFPGSSFS